jgi:hypothetical protein
MTLNFETTYSQYDIAFLYKLNTPIPILVENPKLLGQSTKGTSPFQCVRIALQSAVLDACQTPAACRKY